MNSTGNRHTELAPITRGPICGSLRALKRQSKARGVADDLLKRIVAGELLPGERLPSYKRLGEVYGLSQGVITEAVQRLVTQGIVQARRRSGCFISRRPETGRVLEDLSAGEATESLASYLNPLGRKEESLQLYVSEVYPQVLDCWRRNLSAFASGDEHPLIGLNSCRNGHIEEVKSRLPIDLIQTTPFLLNELGPEEWLGIDDLNLIGMTREDLLPAVVDWCTGENLMKGVPFSLTLPYLFANLDLLAQAGVACTRPGSWEEVFSRARAVDEYMGKLAGLEGPVPAEAGSPRGLLLTDLGDWLILAGAVRPFVSGREEGVSLSLDLAREFFRVYASYPFPEVSTDIVVEEFRSGRAAFLHHNSWATAPLQDVPFAMAVWDLPAAEGIKLPGTLTVLAMRRRSFALQTCLQLLKYLTSQEVQNDFGGLHGNLPVRADAA